METSGAVWFKEVREGIQLEIHVNPGKREEKICGVHAGRLKISVRPRPVQGKANKALTDFLAREFGVSKSKVVVISGASSNIKQVLLKVASKENVLSLLEKIARNP
ncbi:MAG: DUF167 domain-containing protein [Bdellovibrionales bacterium]|nr:DUF167 domain-containing protein [Bdellovibrionales bacterium]